MASPAAPQNARPVRLAIRDMTHRDLKSVVAIERHSGASWCEADFYKILNKPHHAAIVAVTGKHKVIGFMTVEVLTQTCCVLNMAVHPDFRRCRVATRMLSWLQDCMIQAGKDKIAVEVNEVNMPAQHFLQNQKFVAVEVLRDYYPDGRDAFCMVKILETPNGDSPLGRRPKDESPPPAPPPDAEPEPEPDTPG